MKKKERLWLKWNLVFLAVFLLLASPNAYAKEKYVTWLALADYTGPISALVTPGLQALDALIKEANASDGIKGVKIKFINIDTRYDVARNISAYKKYRREHKLVQTFICTTGAQRALRSIMTRDKVIINPPPDSNAVANPGWTFTWGPSYSDIFGAGLDWVAKDWKSRGKQGKAKVGYISWDNPYGYSALEGGKEYAESLPNIELLKPELFPQGTLKHDVWLTRLANSEADYIWVGGTDPTPTNVIKDAYRLGLTKKIQFLTDTWGPSQSLGVRHHPKELEGVIVVSFFLRGSEAQNNEIAKRLWLKQKKPLTDMDGTFLIGVIMWDLFKAAMTKGLDKVGYEKFDGEALYWGYTQITGQTTNGVSGPCAYSKTERRGTRTVKLYRVSSGKLVSITDWVKTPDTVALHEWD